MDDADLVISNVKGHLLELINIHDELGGLVSYESFHDGFILGAQVMIDDGSRCSQGGFSEDD